MRPLQFWMMVRRLSPVRPLQPVRLSARRSQHVVDSRSMAARLSAEFQPPGEEKAKKIINGLLSTKGQSVGRTKDDRSLLRSSEMGGRGPLPRARSWTRPSRCSNSQNRWRSVRNFSLTRPVAKSTVCHRPAVVDTRHQRLHTLDNLKHSKQKKMKKIHTVTDRSTTYERETVQ